MLAKPTLARARYHAGMQADGNSAAQTADVIVVGAGMAGVSVAYFLAPHVRVVVLEQESQPGYHASGRSAALFSETYGNAVVRALSTASKAFFQQPPDGFAEHVLVGPRGALVVGAESDRAHLLRTLADWQPLVPNAQLWSAQQVQAAVPVLRPEQAQLGVYEPDAADIDVHAVHQGFLRGLRRTAGRCVCRAPVRAMEYSGGVWRLDTPLGGWQAPVVVNAAGAWADAVAALAGVQPRRLQPLRRTALTVDLPDLPGARAWPLVIDAQERWYFKPDAGALLLSAANEDPCPPQDVQPEELDVAVAVDRIESATVLHIRRVLRAWAGLRTFAPDRTPVVGFAEDAPGFFWLAGQGGYGIQTAPALGELAAAWVRRQPTPDALAALGITEDALSPQRAGLAAA